MCTKWFSLPVSPKTRGYKLLPYPLKLQPCPRTPVLEGEWAYISNELLPPPPWCERFLVVWPQNQYGGRKYLVFMKPYVLWAYGAAMAVSAATTTTTVVYFDRNLEGEGVSKISEAAAANISITLWKKIWETLVGRRIVPEGERIAPLPLSRLPLVRCRCRAVAWRRPHQTAELRHSDF